MKRKLCCAVTALITLLSCLCGCKENVSPLSATRLMMDTVITVTLYDGDGDILNGALEICEKYEKILSRTVEGSDIYRINNTLGATVEVLPETAELITLAKQIAQSSDGAFDPTVLPLVELWNVSEAVFPPSASEVEAARSTVGFQNISVDGNKVTLSNGATVDLGGIAKGYIADRVKEYLVSKGVTSAIINLGGNTLLVGNKNGEDFSVGVQKPFAKSGELCARIMLDGKTAVTSGTYQRYFEADGRIYHHIIDTSTGWPADNGITSVTVIADSSAVADGLSTACLVLGAERGAELAKAYGVELITVAEDGSLTVTDGLKKDTDGNIAVISLKALD